MYNKRQYQKSNVKKLLHHVKGKWVVLSVALLLAIGGGAAVTHADSINVNALPALSNNTSFGWNNPENNENTWHNPFASAVSNTQNSASSSAKADNKSLNTTDKIQQSANNMHSSILAHNAVKTPNNNVRSENTDNNMQLGNAETYTNPLLLNGSNSANKSESANESSIGAAKNTNHAINGNKFYYTSKEINSGKDSLTTELFSHEAPSPFSMPTNMVADDAYNNAISDINAHKPSNTVISDMSTKFVENGIFGGSNLADNIYNSLADYSNSVSASVSASASNSASNNNKNYIYGSYSGMTYKYNKADNSVEFTGGVMKDNTIFHLDSNDSPLIESWEGKGIQNTSNNITADVCIFHNGLGDRSKKYTIPYVINSANTIKIDHEVDTSKVTNASFMFGNNPNLCSLILPKGFGNNITDASDMFSGDYNLRSLNLPADFGDNITNAVDMFYRDYNLHSLTLPVGFSNNITNATGMFGNNKNLQYLNLPEGFGQNIINAQAMFSNDFRIQSLNLPVNFGCSIHNASYMFENDFKLQSLNLPVNFGKGITNADRMFSGEFDLKFLDLPNNFGKYITNATWMFNMDFRLKSLNLPNNFGINITKGIFMFYDDIALSSLRLSANFGKHISHNYEIPSDYSNPENDLGFNENDVGRTTRRALSLSPKDKDIISLILPTNINSNILNSIKKFAPNIRIIWEKNN